MKNAALLLLLLPALGCASKQGDEQPGPGRAVPDQPAAAPIVLNACLRPDSLALSSQHVRVLAAMFVTDVNRGHTTFGFSPPDPSQIRLLSDEKTCAKANVAFESLMSKRGAEHPARSYPKANLYVYRAGSLYAVLYPDWHSGGDVSDQFMFFDSGWNYLGDRAQ
jgi:hypothetical protein